MDKEKIELQYGAPSAHAPYARWSWMAIPSLLISAITSPPLIFGFWMNRHFEIFSDMGHDWNHFWLASPFLGLLFAIATCIRIGQSQNVRGFPFAIPALIIALLNSLCFGALLTMGGPD